MEYTTFQSLYKVFLNKISNDYRIKQMFVDDVKMGDEFLEYLLKDAIPNFKNCIKPILDVNDLEKSFNCNLDLLEIKILSDLMIISWLNWNINDITQMNITLNDNDFRHHSADKNLHAKMEYSNVKREIVNQDMLDYSLKHMKLEKGFGIYGL